MGSLKPNMAANIRRIRSVLMDDWDPIGVRNVPEASDEYDSFVLPIYSILREHRSEDGVLDYLEEMTKYIGLPAERESLRPIAAKLLEIDLSHDESHE